MTDWRYSAKWALYVTATLGAFVPVQLAAQAVTPAAGATPEVAAPDVADIVVTAQRRSERLQDVPISITAVSGEGLAEQRVINAIDIQRLSPSVAFKLTGTPISGANLQIRGIGTTGAGRSFEGAVGLFVDGVYRTRSGQALQNFLDVDSIQILRGPQGTLFGKNTSAGAILVGSNAPSTNGVSGNYEASYGNYDYYLVRGAINLPVSDRAAIRIAALQTDHTGYFKNVNGGHENEMRDRAVKAQLLLEPTETLSLRLIGDYARSQGNCCYGVTEVINGPLTPFVSALAVANGGKLPSFDPDRYESWVNDESHSDYKDYGGTLLADLELGDATLRSITGLRVYHAVQTGSDVDYTGADITSLDETFRSRFFSQEVTLNGRVGGAVHADYVLGAYYSHENISIPRVGSWGTQAQSFFDRLFTAFGLPAGTARAPAGPYLSHILNQTGETLAGFGHVDLSLSDHWKLIAGLRYTHERKSAQVNGIAGGDTKFDPFAIFGQVPVKAFNAVSSDNALSGTLGLQYVINSRAMLYATYNRGFKAGGVVLDITGSGTFASQVLPRVYPAVSADPVYRPETVDAGEIGAKIRWLDGRATTNVAAFYNAIQNLQVGQFLGIRFAVFNAPKATVYGAEIEQSFRVSDALTLTGAATWLPKADFGTNARLGIISGRRFPTAPKFAGNVGMNGEQPLSDDYAVTARFQLQYFSPTFTNTTTSVRQESYALINGNVGLKSLAHGWLLEAFVNNLSDKRYVVQHFTTALQSGDIDAYVGAPRTFGVSLRGKF